jgi:hypothetical protein
MSLPILAAVLGVLIAAAAIGIPQLVRFRHRSGHDEDDDSRAYLEATGRSARDVAEDNSGGSGGSSGSGGSGGSGGEPGTSA